MHFTQAALAIAAFSLTAQAQLYPELSTRDLAHSLPMYNGIVARGMASSQSKSPSGSPSKSSKSGSKSSNTGTDVAMQSGSRSSAPKHGITTSAQSRAAKAEMEKQFGPGRFTRTRGGNQKHFTTADGKRYRYGLDASGQLQYKQRGPSKSQASTAKSEMKLLGGPSATDSGTGSSSGDEGGLSARSFDFFSGSEDSEELFVREEDLW